MNQERTPSTPHLPVFLALAAISSLLIPSPGSAQGGADAGGRGSTEPVFVEGQAQIVPAFQDADRWIREELWVETEFDSDGDGDRDRVHVAVVRQEQTETEGLKVPVIYESSPYFAGTAPLDLGYFWNVRQEVGGPPPTRSPAPSVRTRAQPGISGSQVATWVPRGFAVVHSEAPGTGLSEGCPTVGDRYEALAPKAVIDWLNGRARGFATVDGHEEVRADWSTGKVGMTGTSFNGTIPVAAATTGVEGLEAIIPIAPNNSYYRYYRSNGLVRSPGGYLGEDIDVLYDFINSGDPAGRSSCNATYRDGEMAAGQDRVSGDYNEFWATRDMMNNLDGIRAATLMSHAFNDWNVMPEHSVKVYEYLKAKGVPAQAYFHQGGHGGPPPLELMNRWFTRYLYGVENGVENDPKAWIVREDDERTEPTPYPDYPNPAASPVVLHLTAGGVQTGGLSFQSRPGEGTETLVDNFSFSGRTLAQAEWTEHRLLYATPELKEDVHVSGTPRINVRLAADRPAANLSIWLVSLPWVDGRFSRGGVITRGWADPQNHSSLTESEPLVPGEFYEVEFELQPDDQIIPRGQRMGLMIFSSDREFTLWPDPGTALTVDLDGTSIEIPVVGGVEALRRAFGG
jgi:X-Pro dipeptidyl-peptidase